MAAFREERVLKTRAQVGFWTLVVGAMLLGMSGAAHAESPDEHAAGKALYDTSCSSCHGDQGMGNGKMATQLATPPKPLPALLVQRTDQEVLDVIEKGKGQMPGWGHVLKPAQRTQLLQYLRSMQRKAKAR